MDGMIGLAIVIGTWIFVKRSLIVIHNLRVWQGKREEVRYLAEEWREIGREHDEIRARIMDIQQQLKGPVLRD